MNFEVYELADELHMSTFSLSQRNFGGFIPFRVGQYFPNYDVNTSQILIPFYDSASDTVNDPF